MKKFGGAGLMLWLSLFGLTSIAADADKATITVFAAASLTNVLQELGDGRSADRKWRARGYISFGRPGMDGLSTDAKSD